MLKNDYTKMVSCWQLNYNYTVTWSPNIVKVKYKEWFLCCFGILCSLNLMSAGSTRWIHVTVKHDMLSYRFIALVTCGQSDIILSKAECCRIRCVSFTLLQLSECRTCEIFRKCGFLNITPIPLLNNSSWIPSSPLILPFRILLLSLSRWASTTASKSNSCHNW